MRAISPHNLLEEDLYSTFLSLLFMCSVTSANPSRLTCSDMKSGWSLRRPASLDDGLEYKSLLRLYTGLFCFADHRGRYMEI